MNMTHGYSFYSGKKLVHWANEYYKKLPKDVTHLVCSSSSGMAIASAVIYVAAENDRELRVLYVKRKKWTFNSFGAGDKLHVSKGGLTFTDVTCFIDDLIDQGGTRDACKNAILDEFQQEINYSLVSDYYNDSSKLKLTIMKKVK